MEIDKLNFLVADENRLVIDLSPPRYGAIVYFLFALPIALFPLLAEQVAKEEIVGSILFGFLPCVVAVAYYITQPKKILTFNRRMGEVSIPGPFWYKNIEVDFCKLVVVDGVVFKQSVLHLYRPDGYKINIAPNVFEYSDLFAVWAFYREYMDKNKELPFVPLFFSYFKSKYGYNDAQIHESLLNYQSYTPIGQHVYQSKP
jgi:hypothetical protein